MNNIKLAACVLLMSCLLLVSCSSSGPKESANSFIKALLKMDVQTAKNYSSDRTRTMLDQMDQQIKNMSPEQKKQLDDSVVVRSKITVTFKDIKESGDQATVSYTTSQNPSAVDSLILLKQNGKWVVDLR